MPRYAGFETEGVVVAKYIQNKYPNVKIELFNAIGGNVIGLVQPVGKSLSLDARNLASGTYHLIIRSNGTLVRNEDIIVKH